MPEYFVTASFQTDDQNRMNEMNETENKAEIRMNETENIRQRKMNQQMKAPLISQEKNIRKINYLPTV